MKGKNEMERQMQIKESKEEINGFTLAKNTEEMAILKVMVKTPWEIAQHPYLSSDYEYITMTKEEKNIFTIVKTDGTTFSFSNLEMTGASIGKLKGEVYDALKKYGVTVGIPTMELPQKMEIYYNRFAQRWQANLSFKGISKEQRMYLYAQNAEEMCKEIEKRFRIKFKPLVHGYAQTGIDIWKTERDYSKEMELSYKKEQQSENQNVYSNVNPKNIIKPHNKQEKDDKEK